MAGQLLVEKRIRFVTQAFSSENLLEGQRAFLEKRQPQFKGR